MDPLTMTVVGTQILGGLVQYYNAEKARGAEKKRLKQIENMFNSIKPPDYDISIVEPPELHQQELAKPEFSSPMAAPNWNLQKLDLKDLEQVQKFVPTIAPLIKEAAPQILKMNEEAKEGRDAQKAALHRFMEVGQGDYDPEYQQRVLEAKRRAGTEAQGRQEAIQQDFERRGLGGSGVNLITQLQGAADSMDRNAMMGLQAETDAYRNQLNALAQGASLGGQIEDREMSMQDRNNAIINNFNQRMSQRSQDWSRMRADALNSADLRNIQEAQRIADFNTKMGNQQSVDERARRDALARYNTDFARGERSRQDQLAQWNYGADQAERAYKDQANILRAKWLQDNIDRKNNMADRRFGNQMDVARGRAGISGQQGAAAMQAARDRNAAIQGLANVGSSSYMQYKNNNQSQPVQAQPQPKPQQNYLGMQPPKKRKDTAYGYSDWGAGGMFS